MLKSSRDSRSIRVTIKEDTSGQNLGRLQPWILKLIPDESTMVLWKVSQDKNKVDYKGATHHPKESKANLFTIKYGIILRGRRTSKDICNFPDASRHIFKPMKTV